MILGREKAKALLLESIFVNLKKLGSSLEDRLSKERGGSQSSESRSHFNTFDTDNNLREEQSSSGAVSVLTQVKVVQRKSQLVCQYQEFALLSM